MSDTFTADQTREVQCTKCGVDVGAFCVDPDTGELHRRKSGTIANHIERVKDRRALAANVRMNRRRELTNPDS